MEYRQLRKQIQQKQLSSCYLLFGVEQFVKMRTLEKLCQAALEDGDPGWNQTVLDEKASAEDIFAACQTLPMFAPRRVVIVKECPFFKQGGGAAGEETILSLIDTLPPETLLVFVLEGKPDGRRKLTAALKKRDAMVEISTMTEHEIFAWLKAYAAQRGKAVEPQALETLIQRVGTDMQTVATEMEKICCYAEERDRITRKDVLDISSQTLEANAFEIVDLLAMGKRRQAAEQIDLVLREGNSIQMFMGAVAYRLRQLLAARLGWEEGKSVQAAAAKVQGPRFAAQRTAKQAGTMRTEDLRRGLLALTEADFALKSGRMKEDRAVLETALWQAFPVKK